MKTKLSTLIIGLASLILVSGSAKAQITIDDLITSTTTLVPVAVTTPVASLSTPSTDVSTPEDAALRASIDLLKQSIQNALKSLEQAAAGSFEDRLARFDKLILTIQSALEEVKEGSKLDANLKVAIAKAENTSKKIEALIGNAQVGPKDRAQLEQLLVTAKNEATKIYGSKVALIKMVGTLEGRLLDAKNSREVLVIAGELRDISAASEAISRLIVSIKGVTDQFDLLLNSIAVPVLP